jgi:5-methylcytosine-specific restriction endonuclease McrA
MGFSDDDLNDIYHKNNGHCWHCGKKLSFVNYGKVGRKAAWEVDHANPRGVDDLRNWVPACISCNRSKQDLTTRQFSG